MGHARAWRLPGPVPVRGGLHVACAHRGGRGAHDCDGEGSLRRDLSARSLEIWSAWGGDEERCGWRLRVYTYPSSCLGACERASWLCVCVCVWCVGGTNWSARGPHTAHGASVPHTLTYPCGAATFERT